MDKIIKILYVDPLSPVGHINFNNIYISALSSINNIHMDFVFQEGYMEKLNIFNEHKGKSFSFCTKRRNYKGLLNKIAWRVDQMNILHYCNKLLRRSKYDYVFFSSFDEISLLLSGFWGKKVIAVCHANAEHIPNSRISLISHKFISQKSTLITLNKALSDFMLAKGIKNTFVPHGLPKVVCEHKNSKRLVFVPVQFDLCDKGIMIDLISEKVSKVLQKHNVKLVLKENSDLPHNFENIIYTDKILSKQDYTQLYRDAGLILLPYNKSSYVFRTSAMLMEAIAYNKNVAVPKVKSFMSLKKDEDKGMYIYDNVEDIIAIIDTFFSSNTIPIPNYDKLKEENGNEVITITINKIINEKS